MSKNKKAKFGARDLTMLTRRAVEHAEARRATTLEEGELEQVVGGQASVLVGRVDTGGVLSGAKGPDPVIIGEKTLVKGQ
jgi:hypothetical protein